MFIRKIFTAGTIAAMVSGAVLLTGCSDSIEGNEQNHPTYIKAKADKDAGHYKDAETGLKDLLLRAPKSAFLHKELATLYADNIEDYYPAIYHYQRYLDISGAQLSSDDKKLILNYIASCKRKAAVQQIQEDPTLAGSTGNPAASNEDMLAMQQEIDILKQTNKAFQNQFIGYRSKIKELEAQLNNAMAAASAAPANAAPAAAAAPAAPAGNADTYEVKPGDTLSKIARKVYGSDKQEYRKIIMQANGMDSPNKLKAGQMLKIPQLPR